MNDPFLPFNNKSSCIGIFLSLTSHLLPPFIFTLAVDVIIVTSFRTEHIMAANKRLASLTGKEDGALMTTSAADEHLMDLPGRSRIMVDLTGWNFQRTLMWRLSWLNLMCEDS